MLSFHCAPSILSVYGGCAAENGNHFSIFSFVFLCYLLLTHDSAYLGLKIVCLKQNRRRVARPDLCRAWCRRGGFIFAFFVCLSFVFHVECTLSGKDGASFCTLWPHTHKHTRRLEVGHVGSVENTNNRKGSNFSFLLFCYVTAWKYDTMKVDH